MSPPKFNFLLAPGVLPPASGVREKLPCAGDGVTFTKSAKLKLTLPGVLGAPKPMKPAPEKPGVMCDDGSGVALEGGVEGGWSTGCFRVVLLLFEGLPGDVAR